MATILLVDDSPFSQRSLAHILETSPHQGIMIRSGEQICYANRACADIFGYDSPEEIVGNPWHILVAPEELPIHRARAEACLCGTALPPLPEWQGVRKNGARIWLESVARPFRWEGRAAILAFVTDITARKRVDESLREREELYRLLTENSNDLIYLLDAAGNIVYASPSIHRLGGVEVSRVLGTAAFASIHPDDAAAVRAAWGRILAGESVSLTFRLQHADGNWRWIETLASPVQYRGQPHVMAVGRDLTERKRAEEQLVLFRALIDQTHDAIEIVDPASGRFLDVNAKACHAHGYTREEYLALTVSDIDPKVAARPWQDTMEAVRQSGFLVSQGEHKRKDGSVFPVEVAANYIRLHRDYILAVVRDITDRKRADQRAAAQHALTKILATAASVDDAWLKILPALGEALKWEVGALWRVAANGTVLECDHVWHKPDFAAGEFAVVTQQITFAPGVCSPGCVWSTGEALWIADVSQDSNFARAPFAATVGLHATMCLPIVLGKAVFGVFEFFTTQVLSPDQDLLQKMADIGSQIGQFIERKRVEDALHATDERTHLILETANDAFITIDATGHILEWNRRAEAVFGWSRAEAIGRRLSETIIPSQHREAHERGLQAFRASGQGPILNKRVEVTALRRDGSEFPVELLVWPTAVNGTFTLSAFVRDITEQKRASAELHRTGDLLRAVAGGTTDAVFVKDRDGRYLLFNPAAARFVGRSVEEVLGKDDTELFDTDSAHRIRARDRQVMETGQAGTIEERLTAAGVTRTYLATKAPYRDEHGAVVGLVGISRDITDRKEAEAALRAAEHRLRHVISSSPAVLYTRAVEGESLGAITWISDNLREMMGYFPEQATDPTWWLAQIHPEDRDRVLRNTNRELFGRGRVANEYRFRHQDGCYRWVRNELRLVRDAADQATEVVGSCSEITERKQLEDQFRQAQKMEAVGRLAGGIAHDFNNLLTVIIGFSEVLKAAGTADDPNRHFIDEIGKAGERAASLTRQLLAFSRKQLLLPIVLDLGALVKNMQKMLSRLIGEDLQLEFNLQPAALHIKADPGQMEQVIMNLVVNSRDAMPGGGKLTVETAEVELDAAYAQTHPGTQPGSYAALIVTDTGCGMDAATQARVFEPFFTTKGPEKGTGLGLAMVFGIVQQSGGSIDVTSEVGVGTTFTIYLPRAGEELHQPKARSLHDGSRRSGATVLLAEDDDGIRSLIRFILEGNGYKVLEACNGLQALAICMKHKDAIDILVSDVVMPNMSGPELARQAFSMRRTMKVLYLSGYTDDAVVRHGMIDADTPYLQKPFTPHGLLAKVREVLDTAPQVSSL